MDFGKRLKDLREAAELTQAKLADLSKMDPSAVAHIEAGRRKPSFHNIRRLAKALNITTDELLNQDKPIMAFRNAQSLSEDQKETVQSLINTLAKKSDEAR